MVVGAGGQQVREGQGASDAELIAHCKSLLADFKKPRSVEFVPDLPRNPNSKLSRKMVRERYWQGRERMVG